MYSPGESMEDLAPPPVVQQRNVRQQRNHPKPFADNGTRFWSMGDWLPLRRCEAVDQVEEEHRATSQIEGRRLGALCAIACCIPHTHVLVSLRGVSGISSGDVSSLVLAPIQRLLPSEVETEGLVRHVSLQLVPAGGSAEYQQEPPVTEQVATFSRALLSAAGQEMPMHLVINSATAMRAAFMSIQQIADVMQIPPSNNGTVDGCTQVSSAANNATSGGTHMSRLGSHNSSYGTLGSRTANASSSSCSLHRRQEGVPVVMVAIHSLDGLPLDMEAVLLEAMLHGTVTVAEMVGSSTQRGGDTELSPHPLPMGDFVLRHFTIPLPSIMMVGLSESSSLASRVPHRVREAFALSTSITTIHLSASSYPLGLPTQRLISVLRMGGATSSPLLEQDGLTSCSPMVRRYIRECLGVLQMSTQPFKHSLVGCMRHLAFYEHVVRCGAYLWSSNAPLMDLFPARVAVSSQQQQTLVRRMGWSRPNEMSGFPRRSAVASKEDVRLLLPHLFSHLLCVDTFEFYVSQRDDVALAVALDDTAVGARLAAVERRVLRTITGAEGGSEKGNNDGGGAAVLMDAAVSWDAISSFTDSIQCRTLRPSTSSSSFSSPVKDATILSHTETLNYMVYLVKTQCPSVVE